MVGRSKNVTGPYVDREGTAMVEGGGSAVLVANAKWVGPGGESLLRLPWRGGWPAAAMEGDGR